MSYNFLDKTGLAYFWSKIKEKIPTKTSQLTNDSHLNYSIEKPSGTIDDLAAFTSGKPGITGSISLTKKSSGTGSEIPAGWYNFYFSPHRTGSGGDNINYGTIILTPMNFPGRSWLLRRSGSATTISEVKEIATGHLEDYIKNSSSYINTHPENSPVLIPFINNDIAFLLKRGGSAKLYYDGVEQTNDMSAMFDACANYWNINPTGITEVVVELTLHKVFAWSNTIYCDHGNSGWRAKNIKIEVMNSNYAEDVWTTKLNVTNNASGNVKVNFNHVPVGASNAGGGFNKVRFTFSSWNNSTIFRIAQLGIYNYGSLGARETSMSRGIDDYVFRNITPNSNNSYNLGSSSNKWANVYATTFQGNATSATKATQDSDGNAINTTYYKASNPNGYTSNTGTITGITMNGASKGTSGVVNLGTVITAHQDISGKVDVANIDITGQTTTLLALTKALGTNGIHYARWYSKTDGGSSGISDKPSGSTNAGFVCEAICSRYNNATDYRYTLICWTQSRKAPYTASIEYSTTSLSWTALPLTDTTYSSKTAASGGTDVSLVTTGEKYTWNSKQNALSSQTAYTSKGSATKVPQITTNSLGQVTGITEVTITQPTVNNGTLTIQKNGTNVQTFSANQSGNATANITVPTKTSDLTNDSGFITNEHVTDVRINGTSILGNKVADIITNTAYNATTNKIATMADVGSGGGIGSSNNTIENIVSLTKAEYDALATKETKTLYNITDDVTETGITRGSATMSSTYISATENNHWERIGKVVSYSFTVTAGGTWSNNNIFATGLPKPVASLRFVGINHSQNVPMRLQINTNGEMGNGWSNATPVSGNQLEGQVTYITNDP